MSPFFKVRPETPCHHCGIMHREGDKHALTINGISRPMCCPGCRAVAEMTEYLQTLAPSQHSVID